MAMTIKNEGVRSTINSVIEQLQKPDSLELITKNFFTRSGVPSDNWSFLNRLIMLSNGTDDARSFRAWGSIERNVLKGSKAIKIVAPTMIASEEVDKKTGKKKKTQKLVGFHYTNVFSVESTDGKPVDYKTQPLPRFKGQELAEEFGVKIVQGFANDSYYAYYDPTNKIIKMATDSQETLFHELCHLVDDKLVKKLKTGQHAEQEIVAEFSSCVLMNLLGLGTATKNTYDYLNRYATQLNTDTVSAIIPLLSRVSKIVEYCFERITTTTEETVEENA